ncbi:cardiolipin synthase [Bacillus sp. TH22]|uniref:cardiolipin synthase n=1 Tax=unclassified Bacillus (in: firmicutes) TaxID=185979 RepID=UPI0019113E9A|nr:MULTISPECIES: cardiolipin synthase [unclassified Bacillus (in: firmicutes)]MBK5361588.1 cardiolipin synthase [Bacillus sp. TH44]MBK5348296.1 cardiolipin synthase [Bacillus sp. TH45]MBK5364806.1 cardiolipin synthase [Bacillus sp. TH50]MBK5450100.1 cardiolipin synthase [Bacillus sp. TH22]MBK5456152.1 cardiolipin synthase [Bacillus sp. TH23]
MFFLSLLLLGSALWITIDLSYGRIVHLKRVRSRSFPLRQSDFRLYTYGNDLYDALFTDIKQAKHHVHVLFFIVKNDDISRTFLKLLIDKAQEGIEVRLLLDRFGSHYLSKEAIYSLQKHGVSFSFCHKVKFPFPFFSANQRNHRKITVIDGKIGYIGGFNIGEEYLGHNQRLGLWRDYHLRLTGEGIQDLQKQFLHDWLDDTDQNLLDSSLYFPMQQPGTILHRFIPTDGAYLQNTFLHLIESAKKELFIGTPYFIPGKKIMNALLKARKRGVQITILVPQKADHALVREAKFPYCRKLIQAGCNIYAFQQGFFHAKIIIVDDHTCDIGTANFDMRSIYINHEINCLLYDKHFIQEVKCKFEEDLERSLLLSFEDVNPLSIIDRGKEWIGTILAFFL